MSTPLGGMSQQSLPRGRISWDEIAGAGRKSPSGMIDSAMFCGLGANDASSPGLLYPITKEREAINIR